MGGAVTPACLPRPVSTWRVADGQVLRVGQRRRSYYMPGRPLFVGPRQEFACSSCGALTRSVARDGELCRPCRERRKAKARYAAARAERRCARCGRPSETALCGECRPSQWAWRAR